MTTPPPDAARAVFDRAVTELRAAPCLLSKRLAKRCAPVVVWHMDQCDALLSRLARAESALRFYADEGNYVCDERGRVIATAYIDNRLGDTARSALSSPAAPGTGG